MSANATILRLPAARTTTTRRTKNDVNPPRKTSESGRKLRLVTGVTKDQDGMATDYSVRLAPGAIARIKLSEVAPGHSWIDWVYVPPDWRDLGLGGQLMRRVLEDADRHGVRLSLEARACGDTDQAALERWYQGLGFVRSGRRGTFGPILVRPVARARAA
ncbi:MAG: GNAT family N-acetyltransferase [Planctomycetes bacterium]|nr:GNAT family N-acetyltransferase [Planctomycetota bacterium]